ncbi:MAG TPA: hypothetical protein VMS64_27710 [Candidatus Methylomirabilis sp.]|nr:hypothetical protein [Candidatus Methylomirabilis sp.]
MLAYRLAMSSLSRRSLPVIIGASLLSAACLTTTPEDRARNEIYWDAAKVCETRYRTLHIDRIDSDGNVSMHADAESRQELPAYNQCYRQAVKAEIEARKKKGLMVPEMPAQEPSADLD